jgi:hypothetical protein
MMKEFSTEYKESIGEASTVHILKIFDKFTQSNWLIADTYNSLIAAFGKRFDEFSFKELAAFNLGLSRVGLRQQDILTESVKRITDFADKVEESG